MYGKIIDGKLVIAPNPMTIGGYRIYNPRPMQYEDEGYLEIIEFEYPAETDGYYEKRYIERDGKIYGEWEETEAPEVPEETEPVPTVEERVADLEEKTDDLGEALNMILEGVTE